VARGMEVFHKHLPIQTLKGEKVRGPGLLRLLTEEATSACQGTAPIYRSVCTERYETCSRWPAGQGQTSHTTASPVDPLSTSQSLSFRNSGEVACGPAAAGLALQVPTKAQCFKLR